MELFKIFGTIAISNSEANENIDETTEKASEAKGKLSGVFEKIGSAAVKVGKVAAVGIGAGATALAGLTKASVDAYADYEQLVGGVETLFGAGGKSVEEYAASVGKSVADAEADYNSLMSAQTKMFKYSNEAFESCGLSANQYMEQVTSFSASLIASLGGDTEAAAEKADQVMVQMADNANKMGSSMESIQNAYQGFSKQNYTMLDNLKLGYGGTKEEMERLLADAEKMPEAMGRKFDVSNYADICDAIKLVQDQMGITGTTADEAATTISGSLGMVKASWENVVTGFASGNGNLDDYLDSFLSSIETFMRNVIPVATQAVDSIVYAIGEYAPRFVSMASDLITQVLPAIVEGASKLINAIVGVLPNIISAIVDALPMFIDGIVQIFNGIIGALPAIMQTLCNALPSLVPQLVNGILSMVLYLIENLTAIIQPLIDCLPEIIVSIIDALMNNLPALIEGLIQLTIAIVTALPQITMALIEALPTIVVSIVTGLWNALPILLEGLGQMILSIGQAIFELIEPFVGAIGDFFGGLWEGIQAIFAPVVEWVQGLFEGITNMINAVVIPWVQIFATVWTKITSAFSKAVDTIKAVFSPVVDFFKNIWKGIQNAFGSVADWFKNIFSKAWEAVKNVFSTGGKIFDGIKDGIVSTFKTVVNGIIGGINKVVAIPFDAINGIMKKIKSVSIMGFKPFSWIMTLPVPQIPKLEKGGVLEKGQVGYLEGNGAEAVVPLEKNKEWISKVAAEMIKQNVGKNSSDRTDEIIGAIRDGFSTLFALLTQYFPEFANMKLVMDSGAVVGELAPAMDVALGRLTSRSERGAR